MKTFKHNVKNLYGVKISKKYLRLAATYRRHADRHNPYWDFSLDALVECFKHESYGTEYAANNGYINGKWKKDINVSMWIEDIIAGNSSKIEYYTPLDRWWTIPALNNVVINNGMFGYTTTSVNDVVDYMNKIPDIKKYNSTITDYMQVSKIQHKLNGWGWNPPFESVELVDCFEDSSGGRLWHWRIG